MATEFQKRVKEVLVAQLHLNHISAKISAKKDGSVVMRKEFFYTHGQSSDEWKNLVCEMLGTAGIRASAEGSKHWAASPKTSYFEVVVRECP